MSKTKRVTFYAMGIALYFVFGMAVKIPLISHIQTDLGYIVFGTFLYLFGATATIVGVAGCLLESMLLTGWVPIGWMAGQAVIGIVCGITYRRSKSKILMILVTSLAVFLGVGVVKTIIECGLYGIPLPVKFVKNQIATIADIFPMLTGLYIGILLEKRKGSYLH